MRVRIPCAAFIFYFAMFDPMQTFMTDDQIKSAVAVAIGYLKKEPLLDFQNVHERTTAHRLAVHLEPLFEGWNVDCEYNRNQDFVKILSTLGECDERSTDRVYPDIIIHHRQKTGRDHNLLVIELKRNSKEDACDRRKLELLTKLKTDRVKQYQYQLGLYINIDSGRFACTWYREGQQENLIQPVS